MIMSKNRTWALPGKPITVAAPARPPLSDRLKKVLDARIKICRGEGVLDDNELCIMQATSYILGYDPENARPPCTSGVIRDFMVTINDLDDLSNRKRAALKKVIPDIINTAPTKVTVRYNYYKDRVTVTTSTDRKNNDYVLAEQERRAIIDNFRLSPDRSIKDILAVVRRAAAIAKFDEGKLVSKEQQNV